MKINHRLTQEFRDALKKGWIKRKKSGNGASYWKGKKLSKEHCEKLSEAHKGKKLSPETIQKLKGRISWNKGKKMSEETRQKVIKNSAMRGKKPANWNGGKRIENGYIMVLKKNHPFRKKDGYIKRSRLVMEKHIGRYLTPEEVVHHKGVKYLIDSVKNKQDDRIENLKLFKNNSEHLKFHYPKNSSFGINS